MQHFCNILRLKNVALTCVILFCCLLSSCKYNEPKIPTEKRKVEFNIGLPMDELISGQRYNKPTHAQKANVFGDPGTYEYFHFPRYLYIFIVTEQKAAPYETTCERIVVADIEEEEWKVGSYKGTLQYYADSLFTYKGELEIELPVEIENYNIRIYAAMSYVPLNNLATASFSNENDIKNMQFNIDNDDIIDNLQNIYSTPYNYNVNGKYYATYTTLRDDVYPRLHILLYHVACKVDLLWNVPDDKQGEYHVKDITALRLNKQPAYIFRPNENHGKPSLEQSYSLNIKSESDVALQYKGRSYFYTIPYYFEQSSKNYFDIVLDTKFDEAGVERQRELTLQVGVDIDRPFVPWIRGNMSFSKIPTISQVKVID